jgi:hypothetical protein
VFIGLRRGDGSVRASMRTLLAELLVLPVSVARLVRSLRRGRSMLAAGPDIRPVPKHRER